MAEQQSKKKYAKSVLVRFTKEEYEQYQENLKNSGLKQQHYLLGFALHGEIVNAEQIEELRKWSGIFADIDKQLRGMGTNVNQMAKVANSTGNISAVRELEQLKKEIKEMRQEEKEKWRSIKQLLIDANHMQH